MLPNQLLQSSIDFAESRCLERWSHSLPNGVRKKTIRGGHVSGDAAARECNSKYRKHRIPSKASRVGGVPRFHCVLSSEGCTKAMGGC